MNINIKGTKISLTPTVKEYVEEKLSGLEKFIRPEETIRVELEVDKKHSSGLIFRAEVDMQPHGHYAEARGNDFYEAFDLLMPKIKEQLTREKDKAVSLRRRRKRVR